MALTVPRDLLGEVGFTEVNSIVKLIISIGEAIHQLLQVVNLVLKAALIVSLRALALLLVVVGDRAHPLSGLARVGCGNSSCRGDISLAIPLSLLLDRGEIGERQLRLREVV